eukprot:CAMPEP_0198605792 /NCGR_PEP_ID=MMETSP1462-20131121/154573_1 /TAXON_ID=1333877 /ORGANISM="Brandtodinium nutriculum, Strain RCC3387" /LENGTH=247 /DNA_ID=CAMNT_0044337595 /DNA_START=82 /DNA_END=820 /DNA_ORIENTATION=-
MADEQTEHQQKQTVARKRPSPLPPGLVPMVAASPLESRDNHLAALHGERDAVALLRNAFEVPLRGAAASLGTNPPIVSLQVGTLAHMEIRERHHNHLDDGFRDKEIQRAPQREIQTEHQQKQTVARKRPSPLPPRLVPMVAASSPEARDNRLAAPHGKRDAVALLRAAFEVPLRGAAASPGTNPPIVAIKVGTLAHMEIRERQHDHLEAGLRDKEIQRAPQREIQLFRRQGEIAVGGQHVLWTQAAV